MDFDDVIDEVGSELEEHVLEEGAGPDVKARPVSSLWILGTMSLLLAVAGSVAFLLMPRGSVLETAEARAELFDSVTDPLPYGLVAKEARRLPSRELVLTYALEQDADREDGASTGTDDPVQVTFMQFPEQRAESVLEEQFQKLRFETAGSGGGRGRGGRGGGRGGRGGGGDSGGGGSKFGGSQKPKLQDAGFLDWQGFSANYARLRHTVPSDEPDGEPDGESSGDSAMEVEESEERPDEAAPSGDSPSGDEKDGKPKKKPKTYDTVRVNLSTGGRCIIAYVRFPVGATGSKEAVSELLSSFRPLAPL